MYPLPDILCLDDFNMNMRRFFLSFLSVFLFIPAFSALQGKWINHSGIDIDSHSKGISGYNHITKMFESERYVYIMASGRLHVAGDAVMEGKSPVACCIDKSSGEMTHLSNLFPVSGGLIIDMAYSPASGILAIVNADKSIDFMDEKDGVVVKSYDLDRLAMPGGSTPNSISLTPDGLTACVATNFGFAVFDTRSGIMTELVKIGTSLNFANKVGDIYVVAASDGFYACDPSSRPSTLSGLTKLPLNGVSIYAIGGIFPAGNDSFLYVSSSSARDKLHIYAVSLADGVAGATPYLLTSIPLSWSEMAIESKFICNNLLEGLVFPTPSGFIASGNQAFVDVPYLTEGVDFSTPVGVSEFKSALLKSTPKDLSAKGSFGLERYQKAVSRDGVSFWFFRPRQGFIMRKVELDGTSARWSDASEIIEPSMSAAINPRYLSYNPDYGVLARNLGGFYNNNPYPRSQNVADGFCSFKDGKWSRLSVFHRNFNVSGYLPLQWGPRGVVFDPCDTKKVYSVESQQGLLRVDITDPADNLLIASASDSNRGNSQFVAGIIDMKWPRAGLCVPSFDSYGTLWFIPYCYPGDISGHESHTELWYWTKEDRLAVKTPADYNAHPLKKIYIPGEFSSYKGGIYALHNESTKNYLIHCPRTVDGLTMAYDHNGTPEDTSDDRANRWKKVIYPNGDEFPELYFPYLAVEDPYDGKILMTTGRGLITVEPESIFNEKVVADWVVAEELSSPDDSPRTLGISGAYGIAFDNLQRKWLATAEEGLYCLSPDRKNILAHFTSKNSPLPSDNCQDILFNPERNSIMIGTEAGIMEFFPEGGQLPEGVTADAPVAYPSAVRPDYDGYVSFRGLDDARSYNILAPDGSVAATLHSIDGSAQWHPASSEPLLQGGTYTLEGFPTCNVIIL